MLCNDQDDHFSDIGGNALLVKGTSSSRGSSKHDITISDEAVTHGGQVVSNAYK